MSYDYLLRGNLPGEDQGHDAVGFHTGNARHFLTRYLKRADRASRDGIRGLKEIAPDLLRFVADARTLRLAWDRLARHGGQAPGPNGGRYPDLTGAEVWDLCRCLGRAIRSDAYGRGGELIRWVSKGPGRGERPLVLSNIEDRVVEKAIVLILQPLLDPLFDDRSYGYRPGRSHLNALAEAERLVLGKQQRRVWLTEDVKDAFCHVPVPRLLQVLRKLLPADDLIGLIEKVLSGGKLDGLRQGGPLSPLMLNVYLNHVLDRPWRRDQAKLPLIRVADDLLIPCRSEAQARNARAELERLLVPAAMPLKGAAGSAVRTLSPADPIDWVGFSFLKAARGLAITINGKSWADLHEQLALAHTKTESPLRADCVIEGWLGARGPCYVWCDRDEVCRRVVATAAGLAFDEVPGVPELQAHWEKAHSRWCELRKKVRDGASCDVGRGRPQPPEQPTDRSRSIVSPKLLTTPPW